MKRYEIYKDSGIQWVGEIPSHWDVVKTSYLFDDIGSGTTPNTNDDSLYDTDNGINWLQTGDLNDGHITKTSKKISQKAIEGNGTLRLYPINSLVIALYGATIGKVGVLDIESTTNQACCVLPPSDKISTDFAYYIFLASKEALLNLASGGGQPNISQAIIKNHRIPYPSYAEQQSIVSFLEDKVGQIDATIAEKEQMLKELKAYRYAIISEAVTKGLDRNVEIRDSGIDKFPMIRSNWNTSKLKYIASIRSGSALPINNIKKDALYEVYGGNGCMGRTDEYNTESPAIIIGRVGALCGNVHLIKTKKWVTDNALILNIKRDVTYEYLYYYLTAYDLNTLNSSNAQPLITGTKVLDVVTPMPSLNEQIMIANYLDDKTSMIDETIDQITVQIVELKSYKSSLITEAVTGKIDLREWKPKVENV